MWVTICQFALTVSPALRERLRLALLPLAQLMYLGQASLMLYAPPMIDPGIPTACGGHVEFN